jgi:ribosomal protein S18 acetylase RimI-like enzyme
MKNRVKNKNKTFQELNVVLKELLSKRIRRMDQKDLDDTASIWANAFTPKFVMNLEEAKKGLEEAFHRSPNHCFVFEKKGKIVGFVMGGKWDEDIICLGPIAVKQEERKKGIASALLKKFEDEAKKSGFSSIVLTTRYLGDDEESRKYEVSSFYIKNGFKEIARSKKKRIMFKMIS